MVTCSKIGRLNRKADRLDIWEDLRVQKSVDYLGGQNPHRLGNFDPPEIESCMAGLAMSDLVV